jgi:hypothetical protein
VKGWFAYHGLLQRCGEMCGRRTGLRARWHGHPGWSYPVCRRCHDPAKWSERVEREVQRETGRYPSGYSPLTLWSTRHDTPDLTGELVGREPLD